jgi:hypothetical protein
VIRYIASLVPGMSVLQSVSAQRINTDAIVKFWQLVDTLKKDHPLDDALWNAYYNLPGNRVYMKENRDLAEALEHRKDLECIFRPSLADSLRVLEADSSTAKDDILVNLLYIKAHEQQLRSYSTLVISPSYLQECIGLAKKYGNYIQVGTDPQLIVIWR